MAHKAAAMAHSLSLENPDWSELLSYLSSFVSITTDMGVESALSHLHVTLRQLFPAWRDLGPVQPEDELAAAVQPNLDVGRYFLENALPVMGMQHIVFNLLKETHTAIPFWDAFWHNLKNLEALLNWRFRRQRFISTCLRNTPMADMESLFDTWSQSLYEKRWREVSSFVSKLEPILGALRATWDQQRYEGRDGIDQDADAVARAPAGAAAFDPAALTCCLNSALLAVQVLMVIKLEKFPEMLAGWAEDCPCHGIVCVHSSQYRREKLLAAHYEGYSVCPMAGKRAPELASGKILQVYDSLARQALVSILVEAPLRLTSQEQARVTLDFGQARDHIKVLLTIGRVYHGSCVAWQPMMQMLCSEMRKKSSQPLRNHRTWSCITVSLASSCRVRSSRICVAFPKACLSGT